MQRKTSEALIPYLCDGLKNTYSDKNIGPSSLDRVALMYWLKTLVFTTAFITVVIS